MIIHPYVFVPVEFLLDPNVRDTLSTWQPLTCEGQPLIHHILGSWCLDNQSNLSNDKLLQYVKELTEMVQLKQVSFAIKQVNIFLVRVYKK